jgi:hypothetical protein
MSSRVDGIAAASVGTGVLLLWSAVQNRTITSTLQDIVRGQKPTPGPPQQLVTSPTSSPTSSPTASQPFSGAISGANASIAVGPLKTYATALLAAHGWPGQFGSFNAIVMSESDWNPHIKNPSSGAYGIAQALGHGNANTAGSESNMYGGYGLSDTAARQANSGNGYVQLQWMVNYIASRYGSPDAAWAYHQANNSY